MSVLTQIGVEIDRIETAKASIKAAIEGKGVSVPADTKIDGMAALISSISGGSGGLETCKLIMTNTRSTRVFYQPALGEYIRWGPAGPGDFITGADVLCGSFIIGVYSGATAENAVLISEDGVWLVTAPAGGTVRFS